MCRTFIGPARETDRSLPPSPVALGFLLNRETPAPKRGFGFFIRPRFRAQTKPRGRADQETRERRAEGLVQGVFGVDLRPRNLGADNGLASAASAPAA